MLLALDVHYAPKAVVTAAVGFAAWSETVPAVEQVFRSFAAAKPYHPGEFYRREMPFLIEAARAAERHVRVEVVIVDAYAWLGDGRPGLGARLFVALGGLVPAVGVAKSAFAGGNAVPVLRGRSLRPLHVSAAGMDPKEAAASIRAMHGPHRLPTLLRRADQLARGRASPDPSRCLLGWKPPDAPGTG